MIHILIRATRKVKDVLRERKVLLYAGVYMIALWILATVLFYIFEKISLFDSFYWAITTTTTVGYGDISPVTLEGKVVSIIVMLSGIGVLGLFLASAADILIEESLKRRRFVKSYMENHVIVLGWDKKLETAIKELLSEDKQVVLVADVEDIPLEHQNLVFIRGDPADDENLKRASVEKAKFALISGKNDTETLLIAIAVENLNSEVKTTCIVSDPKVIQALEKVGVDQVLSTDEFFGLVLSRSVHVPRISILLNEMMSTKGMDVYQEKIGELQDKTFIEAVNDLKKNQEAIAVGIVRNGKVLLNPSKEEKLKPDDQLLYVAKRKLKT